jgi:O-antigen/teichoic acid export membrane protein
LPHNSLTGTGFSGFEKEGIMIYSLTIITTGLITSLQAYLQKKLSYSLSFLPTLLSSLVLLTLIIFAAKQQNLHLLLLSYVISGSVLFISLYFVLQNKYSLKLKTSNLQSFSKTLLLASFPLGLMLLFNLLYAKVDTLILSFFRPTAEVGIYGIAYKFFDVSIAIPAYLANSVYPLLLKKQNDEKGYQILMKKYASLFIFISLVVTFSVLFLSPLIAILKTDFTKSVLPLQLLSLSLPFFFLTSLLQWHFVIRNKMKFLVPLYAFSLLFNIILNIIFIPVFSYYAAAIITGISEALVFLSMLWYFVKSKKA